MSVNETLERAVAASTAARTHVRVAVPDLDDATAALFAITRQDYGWVDRRILRANGTEAVVSRDVWSVEGARWWLVLDAPTQHVTRED
jgi:hypothetical protein